MFPELFIDHIAGQNHRSRGTFSRDGRSGAAYTLSPTRWCRFLRPYSSLGYFVNSGYKRTILTSINTLSYTGSHNLSYRYIDLLGTFAFWTRHSVPRTSFWCFTSDDKSSRYSEYRNEHAGTSPSRNTLLGPSPGRHYFPLSLLRRRRLKNSQRHIILPSTPQSPMETYPHSMAPYDVSVRQSSEGLPLLRVRVFPVPIKLQARS